MRNKKIIRLFLAALSVVGILFFAGCSGSGSSPASQTSQPTVTNSPQPTVTNSTDQSNLDNQTIGGIDNNHDGVRDSIKSYIDITYPDSPKVRSVLTQDAKIMQSGMLDANDKQLSIKHTEDGNKAAACLEYLVGLDNSIAMLRDLRSHMFNTSARTQAYLKYNSDQVGGEVFSSIDPTPDACIFNGVNITTPSN